MRDLRQRRNLKAAVVRTALRTLGALALLAITVTAVRAAWGMYGKFTDASDAESQTQTQLATLQSQYQQVTGEVQDLSTTRGQEAELRERYGVVKPGEGEIDIVRQASTRPAGASADEPWWQRLWQAISVW